LKTKRETLEQQIKDLKTQHKRGIEALKIIKEFENKRNWSKFKEDVLKFIEKKNKIELERTERKENKTKKEILKQNPFIDICPKCKKPELIRIDVFECYEQVICTNCGHRNRSAK
jgi:hypothetical protein